MTTMITVKDAREALRILEEEITERLTQFEQDTETTVADVELRRIDTTTTDGPRSSLPRITITVEL